MVSAAEQAMRARRVSISQIQVSSGQDVVVGAYTPPENGCNTVPPGHCRICQAEPVPGRPAAAEAISGLCEMKRSTPDRGPAPDQQHARPATRDPVTTQAGDVCNAHRPRSQAPHGILRNRGASPLIALLWTCQAECQGEHFRIGLQASMRTPHRAFTLAPSRMPTPASCVAVQPRSKRAGAWPQEAARSALPFAAGSSTDMAARILGEQMGQTLGQGVIVGNPEDSGGKRGAVRQRTAAAAVRGAVADPCAATSWNGKGAALGNEDAVPLSAVA